MLFQESMLNSLVGAKSIRQDQQAGRHLRTVPLGLNALVRNDY